MSAIDTDAFTAEVLQRLDGTPDPRLRELLSAAIRHLHAFAREVSLRPGEWRRGIEFLTATGRQCTSEHQEFVLLSDVLGLSTLMNLLEDARAQEQATAASVLGPLYREHPPQLALGASVVRPRADRDVAGREVVMYGCVRGAAGEAIAGATLDIWLTDEDGYYDLQAHGPEVMDLRGRLRADAAGRYWFRTTLPKGYSIPMDGPVGAMVRATRQAGMRPAHIHAWVRAPGCRDLVTALYFRGDPYIERDAAFGVRPELIIEVLEPAADSPIPALARIPYDFRLAPA